jgi:hypothetical protein
LAIECRARDSRSDSFEVELGGKDAPSDDDWRQRADDVLYFGKLRHGNGMLDRIYKIYRMNRIYLVNYVNHENPV